VAARPWEHAERAKAALRTIMDDPYLGVAVLSSGRLAANVLEDFLPEAPRERAILVLAAQAGVAQALREHRAQGLDDATAISLAVSSLEDNSPLDRDSCEWVVRQIAVAIGIAAAPVPAADQSPPEPATRLLVSQADELPATVTAIADAPSPPSPPVIAPKRPPERKLLTSAARDGTTRVWHLRSADLASRVVGGE
jgi:hypothetical protein